MAAFANADGGVLLLGVREEKDTTTRIARAVEVRGVQKGLLDAEQTKTLVRNNISPLHRALSEQLPDETVELLV